MSYSPFAWEIHHAQNYPLVSGMIGSTGKRRYTRSRFSRRGWSMLNNLDGWLTWIWYATDRHCATTHRLVSHIHLYYTYTKRRSRIVQPEAIEQMFRHRPARWMMFGKTNEVPLKAIASRVGSVRTSPTSVYPGAFRKFGHLEQFRQLIEKLSAIAGCR